MNPKTILTEEGWDEVAPDCKGKDKELRRALMFYWSLEDEDFDFRCKALGKIAALAGTLKAANEVKGDKDAVKHLTDVISASKVKQSELTKAKAEAEKTKALAAKTEVLTQKKADVDAKKQEQEEGEEDEEEEEEEGDSYVKLTTALKTLKLSKKPYYFLVCDAKPYGLIVSKKDIRKSAQAKKELTQIAGGSTRPPKFGECSCVGGKYVFEMEKPPSGLARILQKWVKEATGLGIKVMVGTESADDEEGQPAAGAAAEPPPGGAAGAGAPAAPAKGPLSLVASVGRGGKNTPEDVTAVQTALNTRVKAGLTVNGKCDPGTIKAIEEFQKLLGQFKPDGLIEPGRGTARALAGTAKLGPPPAPPKPIAPPKLPKPALTTAPQVWHGMRNILDTNIRELKKAISAEYANEHPDVLAAIDKNTTKLDVVFEKLDRRLADSLDRANGATDAADRKTELQNSKKILTEYIKYVKSEPLIDHIDSNPFGVDTKLEKLITDHLMHMAKSIGV